MGNKQKHDGDIIKKYIEVNERLKQFDLHIAPWGRLAVCLDSEPYGGYVLNNVENIDKIEGFLLGMEYAQSLNSEVNK